MSLVRSFLTLAALAVPCAALAIPTTLFHQGRLMDSSGLPLDSTTNITFSIYSQQNGGSILWTDTRPIEIEDGFFSVTLGSSVPLDSQTVLGSDELWLEVAPVGSPPLERVRISSVPSALAADVARFADTATDVSGGVVDATEIRINGTQVIGSDGSFTTAVAFDELSGVPAGLEDGDDDSFADIACSSGDILQFDGSGWQCVSAASQQVATSQLVGVLAPENIPFGDGPDDVKRGNAPDADTLGSLGCSDGESALWNADSSAWECGTPPDQDSLASLSCEDGQRPVWSDGDNAWICGDGGGAGGGGALLGSWEFNENNGTSFADTSGAGATLTAPFGGQSSGSLGHSGKAVSFSGGVVEAGSDNPIQDSPYITAEAWIQPSTTLNGEQTVLRKAGAYTLAQVGGLMTFTVEALEGDCEVQVGVPTQIGEWAHVSGSYNGREVVVSIGDQYLADSCEMGPIKPTQGQPFYVGSESRDRNSPYRGFIDEVRLWSQPSAAGAFSSFTSRLYTETHWQNSQKDSTSSSWTNQRSISYDKKYENSVLRINYEENATIRAYRGWNGLGMRILIDGNPCTSPGPIEKDWSHYSPYYDIYYTDNMFTNMMCRETTGGPIGAGSHTITVQTRRTYCSANCWGPYISYRPNGNSANQNGFVGVQEIPDFE